MDEYLTDMKDAVDLLNKVGIFLLEEVVTYYTLKNLPREFDVTKHMILNERKLSSYKELEARLLDKETSRKMDLQPEQIGKALLSFRSHTRRPHNNRGPH